MFVKFHIRAVGLDPQESICFAIEPDADDPATDEALERARVFFLRQVESAVRAAKNGPGTYEETVIRGAEALRDLLFPVMDAGGIEVPDQVH